MMKKALILSLYLVFVMAFLFSVAEVAVRINGQQPWYVGDIGFQVEPGGRLNQKHPTLGFVHLPGIYKLTFPAPYYFHFHFTHGENGLRITHPLETYKQGDQKPEIWIFGCSTTHGWSLNDDETFAWQLQTKIPDHEVVNYGTEGYSNEQALIQFREAVQRQSRMPKAAIVTYASGGWGGHDQRNVLSRPWRKLIAPWNQLGPVAPPYARLGSDGKIKHLIANLEYQEFPLMRRSAFMHFLEEMYGEYDSKRLRSHEVTKQILREFNDLCQQHNIKLMVAFWTLSDEDKQEEWAFCQKEGIATVDMSLDWFLPENNNNPYDGHPSAIANKHFANTIETFLNTNGVLR